MVALLEVTKPTQDDKQWIFLTWFQPAKGYVSKLVNSTANVINKSGMKTPIGKGKGKVPPGNASH